MVRYYSISHIDGFDPLSAHPILHLGFLPGSRSGRTRSESRIKST
jgi:hypothetical protein